MNQNNEAKQKLGARSTRVAKDVASIAVITTAMHDVVDHFDRLGKGWGHEARKVVSSPKTI